MGKRATALKSCPGCGGQVPTACKSCACGYQFRKLSASSPTESPTDPLKRRRTERTRREKPHYFNHLDFEHQFKRRRSRTLSSSLSEIAPGKKKVGKSTNVLNRKTAESHTNKGSRLNLCKARGDTSKEASSSCSSSTSSEDVFSNISHEKALQFAIILADINRKYVGQNFRPV